MPIAYPVTNQLTQVFLSREELSSLVYHDIFEYPLTMGELIKWSTGRKALLNKDLLPQVKTKNGFFFIKDREGLELKRLMRKRISARKIEIAKRAARVLSMIPTIKMVAVTGSLSMENATDIGDIDLMVITKRGSLWRTRLLAYVILKSFKFSLRSPKDKNQKDKLCLNIWLDENHLLWNPKKRNIYTAHEIAQIKPLVNKDKTYQRFLSKNSWINDYWPNAVKTMKVETSKSSTKNSLTSRFFEKFAYLLQYNYMKKNITQEVVTLTRALFHPVDWGKFVLQKLSP